MASQLSQSSQSSESLVTSQSLELTQDEEISWRSAVISAANSHVDLERPLHDLSLALDVQINSLIQSHEELRLLSKRVELLIQSKSQLELQQQQQGEKGRGGIKESIQQFHSHQIETLIHKLQTSFQEEEKRREQDVSASLKQQEEETMNTTTQIKKDLVSKSDLQQMLSMTQITQNAKKELTNLLQDHLVHTWKSKSMSKLQSITSNYSTTLSTTKQDMEQSVISHVQQSSASNTKTKEASSCTNVLDAANWIQSDIHDMLMTTTQDNNDNSPSIKGSTIVYGPEWTSDTYHQPHQKQQQHVTKKRQQRQRSMPRMPMTLGKSPIRSYIPQDWERLFPTGWEEWDLDSFVSYLQVSPLSYIPPFILHSLPYPLLSILNQINMDPILSTIGGGVTSGSITTTTGVSTSAPPETIFNDNIHLGHCWPFAGSNGKVTLRLSSPMIVTGVTIDHAPPVAIVSNQVKKKGLYNQGRSAPRKVSVEGFHPCDEGDEECFLGMGFDVTSSVQLSKFEYQLVQHQQQPDDEEETQVRQEGGEDSSSFIMDTRSSSSSRRRSSQTFDFGTGIKPSYMTEEEEEEEEDTMNEMQGFGGGTDPSSGSCSATQPSCGFDSGDGGDAAASSSAAPLNSAVQALTIHVEDNWGHPDYTCIYRIRVHGQVA